MAQDNPKQAAELLILVIEHPASNQNRWLEGSIRDSAKALLTKLENDLPPETYTAALERIQELELEDMVAILIKAHDI